MTMDTRPPDRESSILIPILIGTFSLLGICLVFAISWFWKPEKPSAPPQINTPFKYALLATETTVPTSDFRSAVPTDSVATPTSVVVEETAVPLQAVAQANVTPNENSFVPVTGQTEIPTEEIFTPTFTITPDPIFTQSTPITTGTYDDSNPNILRIGTWSTKQNVSNAFQKTLLVSNQDGNYIAFSFIGQKMMVGYQSSMNAGEMLVSIDGNETTMTQLVGNAWSSQEFEPGTHYVILTHFTGASINIDYIDIPW